MSELKIMTYNGASKETTLVDPQLPVIFMQKPQFINKKSPTSELVA